MEVRTRPVVLHLVDDRTSQVHECLVWCGWTVEVGTTPAGEKPLDWMLLTTRPVQNLADVKLTIFGYSIRWRVEEFHKAWKSGACDVEDLQLHSERAIRTWATLLAAIRLLRLLRLMQLLRMTYLSRNEPTLPATAEFTTDEIHAVHIARNKEWNGKLVPSIAQITLVRWLPDSASHPATPIGELEWVNRPFGRASNVRVNKPISGC